MITGRWGPGVSSEKMEKSNDWITKRDTKNWSGYRDSILIRDKGIWYILLDTENVWIQKIVVHIVYHITLGYIVFLLINQIIKHRCVHEDIE